MSDRPLDPFPYTPRPHLVADLGGTNTRLALADGGVLRAGSIRRYSNAGHPALASVLADYLGHTVTGGLDGVCVAVAGPVVGGVARMTNLDWTIDASGLIAATGARRAVVLNDLQAQAMALSHLPPHLVRVLRPERETGTRLAVGLGTGFNAAPVHQTPRGAYVPPSESGHIHLPRHGTQEEALARHLANLHGIATVEEVLSGRGLVALHRWLGGGAETEAGTLMQGIAAGDAVATETGRLFVQVLGRVLGTLALIHLPRGGIYLTGGVARAFAPHLLDLGLIAAFSEMGRFSGMMDSFGLAVVEDDYAALTGCAVHLLETAA